MKAGADRAATPAWNSTIPTAIKIEIYAAMDQIGTDGKSRPANEWSRATTLKKRSNNPLPGAEYH